MLQSAGSVGVPTTYLACRRGRHDIVYLCLNLKVEVFEPGTTGKYPARLIER